MYKQLSPSRPRPPPPRNSTAVSLPQPEGEPCQATSVLTNTGASIRSLLVKYLETYHYGVENNQYMLHSKQHNTAVMRFGSERSGYTRRV